MGTAVKALIAIASSPLRIDLRCILKDSLPVLSSFLRKNQRALKLSTLVLLDTLVKNYPGSLDLATLSPVLAELPPLVSETDLHIAQLRVEMVKKAGVELEEKVEKVFQEIMRD